MIGNILIVDDDPAALKLLREILASKGHVVRPFNNGELALRSIMAEAPELIVLDIRMPGMSGFEVCRRLKENERLKDIPVIFLSAASDMEDKVMAFEQGGADYISKPFQREEVIARVKTHIALSHTLQKIKKSEERYRSLFENMIDGFAYCKMLFEGETPSDLIYLSVNAAFYKQTGLKDVIGKKLSEVIPGILESNPELIKTYGRVSMLGGSERFETYVDELKIWLFISVYSPEKEHFVAVFENITERKLADEAIRLYISSLKQAENELRISAAAFDTHDAIMMTDANAFIIKVNRAFTTITGYSPDEVIGRNPRFMKSGLHDKAFYVEMFNKLEREGKWEGEIWDKRKNGEIYPRWITITVIKNERLEVIQYVSIFSDITERKKNEELIHKMAFFDPLTQLPNRRMLTDRLGQTMASNKRKGIYGAIMFMDLDKFKPLNDTHGHVVGDLLLIDVGRRIKSCIREADTVARFGGDEFVVMLGELNADKATSIKEASNVAEKIRVCLSETYFLKPQVADTSESCVQHNCSSSIGVTLFSGQESGQEVIFKQADVAMYKAKEGGRNLVCFYDANERPN